MAVSKVGLGWDVGERDYASLNLWASGKSASGVAEQAHCKGSCTTATLNITSGFAAGALIYGDVEYDGSNESALAFANHRINITIANVIAQDLLISQPSNFLITAEANGSGVVFRRCRIKHLGAHSISYAALKALNGGTAENCVVSTAGSRVSTSAFNNPLTFSNCQFFGSTGSGVAPIYSIYQTVINCFSFNNASDDYFTANPSDETFNCASEDLTGNVTGYTSAECVDFASNDFRIKNTSDLHALNIGAFFEPDGGPGTYSSDVAFSWPVISAASSQSSTVQDIVSNASVNWPLLSVLSSQQSDTPKYTSSANLTWPVLLISADQVSTLPDYNSDAQILWPLLSVQALESSELPSGSNSVAITWTIASISASQTSKVPEFSASLSFNWPIFNVDSSVDILEPVSGFTIAFSWPAISVLSDQSSVAPSYDSSAIINWPMLEFYALSGDFAYFTDPQSRADIEYASRIVDIPSLSRRVDI